MPDIPLCPRAQIFRYDHPQIQKHAGIKADPLRSLKLQCLGGYFHHTGTAGIFPHSCETSLQGHRIRRRMFGRQMLLPVKLPGRSDHSGPDSGLRQDLPDHADCRRLSLGSCHADHRHGSRRFSFVPCRQKGRCLPLILYKDSFTFRELPKYLTDQFLLFFAATRTFAPCRTASFA